MARLVFRVESKRRALIGCSPTPGGTGHCPISPRPNGLIDKGTSRKTHDSSDGNDPHLPSVVELPTNPWKKPSVRRARGFGLSTHCQRRTEERLPEMEVAQQGPAIQQQQTQLDGVVAAGGSIATNTSPMPGPAAAALAHDSANRPPPADTARFDVDNMKIACLQFAPELGQVERNKARAEALLESSDIPSDLDWLILPEMALSGRCSLVLYLGHALQNLDTTVSDCTILAGGNTTLLPCTAPPCPSYASTSYRQNLLATLFGSRTIMFNPICTLICSPISLIECLYPYPNHTPSLHSHFPPEQKLKDNLPPQRI